MNIILASNSPRRREILNQLNLIFEVVPSDFEEAPVSMEPHALAEHFAYMKAMDVFVRLKGKLSEDTYIIGSDTIVYCQTVMGKPQSDEDAYQMLKALSNKDHYVISGISVIQASTGKAITIHESTRVWIRELEDREIKNYIASGEPMDKAGAYAIQGIGSLFIEKIQGCYFNVVGLPVNKLYKIMKEFGVNLI
ncbi:MAG: septum formation protein Maf [Clostridiales bacterium GWB2_37_7]|nr:MAG: septum formation protein Maf [Clostridiales bacterium GWB2_37_7]